jgi:DNA-binding response OmpR family regulator
VLMLTVRGTKKDTLEGLASGADDCVVKGSPISEVLARLTHVDHSLRREPGEPASRSAGGARRRRRQCSKNIQ